MDEEITQTSLFDGPPRRIKKVPNGSEIRDWAKVVTPWIFAIGSLLAFLFNNQYISRDDVDKALTLYVREDIHRIELAALEQRLARIEDQNSKILDRIDVLVTSDRAR